MMKISSASGFFLVAGFITALIILLSIAIGWAYTGDIGWYKAAAEGRLHELIQPYSGRFLHPFLVGLSSSAFSLDITLTFLGFAIVLLFLVFAVNGIIVRHIIKNPLFLMLLFFTPFFFEAFRAIFNPDIFYTLLTALFFLTLFRERESTTIFLLFLLFLTRESTMLLGVLLAVTAWFRSKRLFASAVVLVIAISVFTVGAISSVGQPNIHGLGSMAYLVAKSFYNITANMFGVKLWVNTYTTCEPIAQFILPHFGFFGNIREIGFCGFDPSLPLKTLTALLTTFGVMPLVLFYIVRKYWKQVVNDSPFWVFLAMVYGIAHYFFAIPAGTGMTRIVGYAWPAFLLAAPFFMKMFFKPDKNLLIGLSGIHLFVVWFPFIVQELVGDTIGRTFFAILIVFAAYFFALRIIKKMEFPRPA